MSIARRRTHIGTLLLASVVLSACGLRPEGAIVGEFFAQSRLRDKTALQHVATVAFEPQVNGIVQRFEITTVTPEEHDTKDVTITAQVKLPDGSLTQKTIVLTMAKTGVKDDPQSQPRWVITGFIEETPRPANPPS